MEPLRRIYSLIRFRVSVGTAIENIVNAHRFPFYKNIWRWEVSYRVWEGAA